MAQAVDDHASLGDKAHASGQVRHDHLAQLEVLLIDAGCVYSGSGEVNSPLVPVTSLEAWAPFLVVSLDGGQPVLGWTA